MLERDGRFTWSDADLDGGIRQDVTESVLRYRRLSNLHGATAGAKTKVKGLRRLYASAPYGSSYDTYHGIDARFNDGTQKLVLFLDNGTNVKANIFVNASRTLSEQAPTFARRKPWVGMFANKLVVADGVTLRAMDSASNWTTPGLPGVTDPTTFGTVYANRLVLFGDPSYPYFFYPSGVRNVTDWDEDIAVEVTSTRGELINGASTCGPFLLVGGEGFIRAYYLGTASPVDWDWDSLSELIGPVNWQSMVTVNKGWGNSLQNFTLFWTKEGPMMAMQQANKLPTIMDIGFPLRRLLDGTSYQGLVGMDLTAVSGIEGTWVPELDEVRYAFTGYGDTQRHYFLCLNMTSAARYAAGEENSYPHWYIRENSSWDFPASCIFTCEVDPDTGLPNTSGQIRAFCGQNGLTYEMDARSDCLDDGQYSIAFYLRRDGYDGADDGVQEHTKTVRGCHLRSTQVGDYDLNFRVIGNGRFISDATINLSNGLILWNEGIWGDGNVWNMGEFVTERGGHRAQGQKFDVEIFDSGSIESAVEINSWALWGYLEDRR